MPGVTASWNRIFRQNSEKKKNENDKLNQIFCQKPIPASIIGHLLTHFFVG